MSPRPHPHPLALFSLLPLNERANAVVADPSNAHLVSKLKDESVLDIGLHIRSKSPNTLATLGRGDVDVYVAGSTLAKIQCSFEIDQGTNTVMLYDRSHSQTTQVFGDDAIPFEHGRTRKIVVHPKLNSIIGMGGAARNLVLFKLQWHHNLPTVIETVQSRQNIPLAVEENPRLARTIDEADTVLPSRRATRLHTPGPGRLKIRYAKINRLGSGQFGEVHKVVDADSGRFMAVKILMRPGSGAKGEQDRWMELLKREVETLARIDHPHIVDYIASQCWDRPEVEIFMGLKEGTLRSLAESRTDLDFAGSVFKQMLQALDCLAYNGIIHRDVKPDNILYTTYPNGAYHYQLGDFGLCNRNISAHSQVGSPLFMAPEVYRGEAQTHKVDVWSLFVTMVWLFDGNGFRQAAMMFKTVNDVLKAVSSAASNENFSMVQEMAIVNPVERASAAQILLKHFGGEGLSTPRNQVIPPLTPSTRQQKGLQRHTPPPSTVQSRVRKPQASHRRRAPLPMIEKRLEEASIPVSAENPQIPRAFPSDNADRKDKKRKEYTYFS
ncbi:hypothetical protein FQN52_008185 [Onygenales sp. PD_12]|nr:hypothetical protein FQN52_008185 [Onygenales sp. PD_12]KAK2788450.1 hypothetical protein FQN53_003596 [Emmonsiellopsis sp. PD_33]